MENSEGLPVGVQIVGRVWEDEQCLKLMELIESLIKFEK
jgi:Asp-tRNA(Asn)/Glu-tRNA(Gln) amidotransferase A subunit family amidase